MPNNSNVNGKGKSNAKNGRGGPPPWAGKGRHVERTDSGVAVGRRPREDARERIEAATSQLDRVEAKLDLVLSLVDDGGTTA